MVSRQVEFILAGVMLLDALAVVLGLYAAAFLAFDRPDYFWHVSSLDFVGLSALLVFINNFLLGMFGLYSASRPNAFRPVLLGICCSALVQGTFVLHGAPALGLESFPPRFAGIFVVAACALLACTRIASDVFITRWQRRSFSAHRLLLVGDVDRVEQAYNALDKQRSWGHRFIGMLSVRPGETPAVPGLPCLGDISLLADLPRNNAVDEVVFALSNDHCRVDIGAYLAMCEQAGVSYRIVPAMHQPEAGRELYAENVQGTPTIVYRAVRITPAGVLYKRLLDIALSLAGIAMLAVIFPLAALAIKLDTPGPILFRQKRVGQNGRVFDILKFRTMVADAEARKQALADRNIMQGHVFKMKDDPRVTRVGRFLRVTSLDEFPQFVNVLMGAMSIVGTRPPTVEEFARYDVAHRRRLAMRPGITGLWQISGRSDIVDFAEIVKLDLKYIDNWSLASDILIILKTVKVMVAGQGAH